MFSVDRSRASLHTLCCFRDGSLRLPLQARWKNVGFQLTRQTSYKGSNIVLDSCGVNIHDNSLYHDVDVDGDIDVVGISCWYC